MAQNTTIEWADHTFNPWWGCTEDSAACANCYARIFAERLGLKLWGPNAERRFFGEKHWNEPLRWNERAKRREERERVFCASMADVFEDRSILDQERERLWNLIRSTPWLNWLLLTKRPDNIAKMAPWANSSWPDNIWLGATVENMATAERRLPHLLSHGSAIRFLSCEPLLESLDLKPWMAKDGFYPINWVIAGGESGNGARPMHPDWAIKLLSDCKSARVPFLFKQWGSWVPVEMTEARSRIKEISLPREPLVSMVKLSKKMAGRTLAGQTWNELPTAAGAPTFTAN